MSFYVYMLKCITCTHKKTYVGYTSDLNRRLHLHNNNKGAKFTKGNSWILIFKKKFSTKSKALSYEYKLKHDRKLRLDIYNKFK